MHRVVVIGSGFGGLFAAKALRKADASVTLIDRNSYHLFQPLLYQVATGILSEGEVAPPTREILRRQRNVRVLIGEVTSIDVAARTVTSRAEGTVTVTPYDSLIVAAGAGQSYFGHDEFAAYAPGLKSIGDALQMRARIFGAFEMAELAADDQERASWLSFVVVGGGPTGVEMAGQLAELSRRSLDRNFTSFDPATARIVLVEAADGLLRGYGPRLSRLVKRDLERLGVEVRTGSQVVGVDAGGVDILDADGGPQRISTRTKVWAAGVTASPLGRMLASAAGAEADHAGHVPVLPDLTLPGHPQVFLVGDLIPDSGFAQVAIQSGQYAARQIGARLSGRRALPPFRYRDKGMLATIARFRAVAAIGPVRLAGFPAWLLWLAVHLYYLVGFKNRVTVVMHWAVSFVGRGRSERTITALPGEDIADPATVRPPAGSMTR
jgi:NADH:ubiquinone reductase (H+-translocating)